MSIRLALALLFMTAVAFSQKKDKDEMTQVLDLPKDPPLVAVGEVRRLTFQVSPLSTNGLLSQQTKDAVKALLKLNGGGQLVHVRAFVAGNGDIRRVPQIISDYLTEKRQQLPSISVIRAGALSLENSQVVLEAVSQAKKDVSPAGLEFNDSGAVTDPNPSAPPRRLLEKALEQLSSKATAKGTLQVTCFVSTIPDGAGLLSLVSARFPGAAANVVMSQRGPSQGLAHCQSVRRGAAASEAGKLAFTGTRVAFGMEEKDATLAFQRLDRDLSEAGLASARVVFTNVYVLTNGIGAMARKLRQTSGTMVVVPVEGVAAVEAGFASDVVAAGN
jgi:enamine deaminase RidA (YjgF/YER057c/UK114 family)